MELYSSGLILAVALFLIVLITWYYTTNPTKCIQITDKAIDLKDVIPIQTIECQFVINGNGDITAGYKLFLPEVFTTSEENSKKYFDDLDGILKMFKPGTIIHQQNFIYQDNYNNPDANEAQNYIHKENLNYYVGRPILNSYTHLYITFSAQSSSKKNYSSGSLLRKPNYPFKQPYRELEGRIDDINSQLINFENGIKGMKGFEMIRMNDENLRNSIYDYMNCSYHEPTSDASSQAISPIAVDKDHLKIGNQFVSILTLVEEGGKIYPYSKTPKTIPSSSFGNGITLPDNIRSKCSMIYPLTLGLPFNHVVNVTIEITDMDTTISRLKSESGSLNFLSVFYDPARIKQRNIEGFCKDIAERSCTTSYTSVNVIINDPDRLQMQRKVSLATNAFMNMNHSKCYVENYETANLFFTSIPGNARSNYRGFVNTTDRALCYLNKDGLYLSDPTGYIFLDRFGKPIVLDLWGSKLLSNKNSIMIGPSGTGKSYWMNNFILQCIVLVYDTVIIDIGGSYKSLITLNNGKYFDSRDIKKFSFNPFLCKKVNGKYIYINNDPDDNESSEDTIKVLATIIGWIWKKDQIILPKELALLKESIIGFYDYVNANGIFPTIIEYDNFITSHFKIEKDWSSVFDVKEISLLLKPYTKGEFKHLLNGEENIDIVNDTLIGFDMEAASKAEYFPIISIIILHLVAEKIKHRKGIRKRLIIDEALDFLMDEKMSEFIAYLYRTFRKKEGGITIAAQNVQFLAQVPPLIKESIIINSDTKIILDHSNYRSSHKDLKAILSLTDDEIDMLDSIQTGDGWRQFFIKLGQRGYIFSTDVCDVADAAYDSRESTVVEIQRLFKECNSLPGALNQYLENKRKKNKTA